MLAVFSLFNVPEALQARYELFHTAYVSGRGITIVDQPLVPGQNLTSLLQIAKSIKEAHEKSLLTYTANESGFYAYYNGTLALAVEKAEGDSWSVKFGEWTSRRLDVNTWLNFTTLWIDANGTVLEYLALAYVRHINESHKLYVITLAHVDGGRYSLAFTWANYWFKNKTVYFGDWVVAANTTLSGYYAAMSRAVDALAKKWQASDKQYKPQAYPQISQALREISRAVAGTDIDKPLGRGYALVTDLAPAVKAFIITAVSSVIIGLYPYTTGVMEDRKVIPFRVFLFTFLFIVLSHYVYWVWWMGKYSVFSFLVGVSIPFFFCLATCYAPERRFRGCKEFENYRSFVTPYTLILAGFPFMPGVIHTVITEGVTTVILIISYHSTFFVSVYISLVFGGAEMVYTPLDLRASAGQMYATAIDVAWTIVARRLGEAVSFGVASNDITAHRAYRDQWSVARCGFFAFSVTTISAFVSPFVSGTGAVNVAGGLSTVAGPSRMLKRYLFSVAVFTILIGVIYLWLGVSPFVVFLTVVVSLSGFLTAVFLLKRRLDVSTEKALETTAPGYFTNLVIQRIIVEALLVGDFWAMASAVAGILLLAFFMPYSLAKSIIQHETKTQ